jgi:tetratricopeptide (TPR) repeat protein
MRISGMLKRATLAIAIATVGVPVVMAQSELNDESMHKARKQPKEAKAAPLFPNATRVEPGLGVSEDMVDPINKLLAEVNGNKNNDDAIATAEKLASDKKANKYDLAMIFELEGFAHANKGDGADGVAYLQKSLDENALSNNEQYTLMLQLVQTELAIGQSDAGLVTLARVVAETKQDKPEYNGLRGRLYYQKKDYANAAQSLQKSVDGSEKPNPDDQKMLLESYFELKQPERAEKVGEDFLHAHPDDKAAILNLATIYQMAGQADKTLALLDDAHKRGLLTTADDYRQLYVLYSNVKGHENDSVAVINEGLQKGILQPNAEVYTVLAEDYYFTNQIPQAIDAYKKADAASTDGEAALNLAKVYNNEGRAVEAKASAQRALQKGIKHPEEARGIIDHAGAATSKSGKKK